MWELTAVRHLHRRLEHGFFQKGGGFSQFFAIKAITGAVVCDGSFYQSGIFQFFEMLGNGRLGKSYTQDQLAALAGAVFFASS